MVKEIYFKPALQIENTGDLLINKAAIDLLRTYGRVIIDDKNTPDWFIDQISVKDTDYRLSEISGKSLFRTIFRKLMNGQINTQIYLVIQPGHTSRKGRKIAMAGFREFLKFSILKALGCRIIRTGFSIGPFDNYNAWMESLSSKNYYHYAVRDNESLELAKKYKFKQPQYAPDLAWNYSPRKNEETEDQGYYVLSFRSNPHGKVHDASYLNPIKQELHDLLKRTIPPQSRIIVAYQVKYDRDASIDLVNELAQSFPNIELLDKKLLLNDAERLYSGAKCVISNRLHVLLLAMQVDSLALPFVYETDNRKITSIYKDNQLSFMILPCNEKTSVLADKVNYVLKNKAQILEEFRKLVYKNKKLIRYKMDEVFDVPAINN